MLRLLQTEVPTAERVSQASEPISQEVDWLTNAQYCTVGEILRMIQNGVNGTTQSSCVCWHQRHWHSNGLVRLVKLQEDSPSRWLIAKFLPEVQDPSTNSFNHFQPCVLSTFWLLPVHSSGDLVQSVPRA